MRPDDGDPDAAGPSLIIGAKEMLALETTGDNHFRSRQNLDNGLGFIFGGQPMVQGLAAAAHTVPDWPAHSFTGHFLRVGAVGVPVEYAVERSRDGRRFASRRVLASQAGKPIFDMLCAFHDPEDGLQHQFGDGPTPPDPATLESLASFLDRNAGRLTTPVFDIYRKPFPIELRLIEPDRVFFEKALTPERTFWFRLAEPAMTEDPRDHQALLAFLSDFWFAGTVAMTHVRSGSADSMSVVTLNHSLWFHAPLRADDWLLYRTESPWAGDGRGLVRGLIYDRSGRLVASAVQEISMRVRRGAGHKEA